jgi:hypothetical protein
MTKEISGIGPRLPRNIYARRRRSFAVKGTRHWRKGTVKSEAFVQTFAQVFSD